MYFKVGLLFIIQVPHLLLKLVSSLELVDICWDLGVHTSLTAIAITRAFIPVLETNALHCVCKCVVLTQDGSCSKTVRLSLHSFRFLPVNLTKKKSCAAEGTFRTPQTISESFWKEIGRNKFNAQVTLLPTEQSNVVVTGFRHHLNHDTY